MEALLCFEDRNGSCFKTVYPLTIRIILYIILGSIEVLTVCGNLLVIIAVAHFKHLHTPTNYLVLSLAVADLLLGILVMFPSMVQNVETCWYFGELFCKVYQSSTYMLSTASIINLSFISIERYYAVCQPLKYRNKITVTTTLVMILISWIFSFTVSFGMIFFNLHILGMEGFYLTHIACEGRCLFFQSAVSSTLSTIFAFYLPGIIMLSIYIKILLVAQRQATNINNTKCLSSARVEKSQGKATKTLAIIMGVFLSFWTPFFVCYTVDPFINYSIPPVVPLMLAWVGFLNSTVNPLVYAFFYSWFRRAITLLISREIFKANSSKTKLVSE